MNKKNNIFLVATLAAAVFLGCAFVTHANGFGVTVDKVVGDYTANVDYDAINGIFAGQPVQFAFQLFTKDRSQQLEFNDAWVTITPASSGNAGYTPPVFEGSIVGSTFPPTGITFTFLAAGDYNLTVQFNKGEKISETTVAQATFPLKVLGGSGNSVVVQNNNIINLLEGGAAGLVVGALAVWFFKRKS